MTKIVLVLIILELINIISFQIYHGKHGSVTLERIKCHQRKLPYTLDGRKATYIISGLKSRTPEAFDFLIKNHSIDGDLIYVEYQNPGLDPKKAAEAIHADIMKHSYRKVVVVSASMGYHISYLLAQEKDLRHACIFWQVALCPCLGRESLIPRLQENLSWLWLGQFLTGLLGWLALLPVIKPTHGNEKYSLILLMDQYKIVNRPMKIETPRLNLAVLSHNDGVLNNRVIRRELKSAQIYEVHGRHANFKAHGAEYLGVIRHAKYLWN